MVFAMEQNVTGIRKLILEGPEIPDPLAMASLASRAVFPIAAEPGTVLSAPPAKDKAAGIEPIESLLQKLKSGEQRFAPTTITIQGAFFGCHLLFPGWWALPTAGAPGMPPGSPPDGLIAQITRVQKIRHWLNTGFQQWGPSWDLTDPGQSDLELYGQIGHIDEANSLPVIVAPGKARRARLAMGEDLAINSLLTGTLYHRDRLDARLGDDIRAALDRLLARGMEGSHFVAVTDEDDSHQIVRATEGPDVYSAYLWQCLVRTDDEARAREGLLPGHDTILLWEHTNLFDRDSIKFNFDALTFKREYLEKLMDQKLKILQQSYAVDQIVGGPPTELLVKPSTLAELLAKARASVHHAGPERTDDPPRAR